MGCEGRGGCTTNFVNPDLVAFILIILILLGIVATALIIYWAIQPEQKEDKHLLGEGPKGS